MRSHKLKWHQHDIATINIDVKWSDVAVLTKVNIYSAQSYKKSKITAVQLNRM